MPIEILMPALSPTMTEGNLAKWLRARATRFARARSSPRSRPTRRRWRSRPSTTAGSARSWFRRERRASRSISRSRCCSAKARIPAALAHRRRAATLHRPRRHRRPRQSKTSRRRLSCSRRPRTARAGQPGTAAMAGSLPARWPAAWRSRPVSTSLHSPARDRRGGSSNPTSKPPSRRRDRRPRGAGTSRRQSRPRRL